MPNSRRQFLKAGAAALTAASQSRVVGANDVINIGVIGLGGNGRGHLRSLDSVQGQARVVAVCDIYKPRLEEGVRMTGAKAYTDYRKLLEDPEIDAVSFRLPTTGTRRWPSTPCAPARTWTSKSRWR